MANICLQSWTERYRAFMPRRVLSGDSLGALERWAGDYLSDGTCTIWLARAEATCVGVIVLSRQQRGRLVVEQLFVLPQAQGTGIGTALMARAMESAGRSGTRLELWAAQDNHAARGWYGHLGGRACRVGGLVWNGYRLPMVLYRWNHLRPPDPPRLYNVDKQCLQG